MDVPQHTHIRGKFCDKYAWKGPNASQRGSMPTGSMLSYDSVLRPRVRDVLENGHDSRMRGGMHVRDLYGARQPADSSVLEGAASERVPEARP